MSVRLLPARDPANLPEYTLWRMTKDGRVVEARTRFVLGAGIPELRILFTRENGELYLLWSLVLKDGHEVRELAQEKQREFAVGGWTPERQRAGESNGQPEM